MLNRFVAYIFIHYLCGSVTLRIETSDTSKDVEREAHWREIDLKDLEIGDRIGGGGFALVYRGNYKGTSVAVKALVRHI